MVELVRQISSQHGAFCGNKSLALGHHSQGSNLNGICSTWKPTHAFLSCHLGGSCSSWKKPTSPGDCEGCLHDSLLTRLQLALQTPANLGIHQEAHC